MKREILLLGNPLLREVSAEVSEFGGEDFRTETADLKDTLNLFRKESGFGRGIAAPQIGVMKRIISLNLGKGAFVLINPEITWRSDETFTMWDDCMSFPDLYVKVRRHRSISLKYLDEEGTPRSWERLGRAESELLQHETDHLNGILAVDRATDRNGTVYKSEFEKSRDFYLGQVDYVIPPT